LRVEEEHELTGLDLSLHSENAYVLGGATAGEHLTGRPRHDSSPASSASVMTPALGRER
jgi:hypothetical protein